jgi:hypothetical protein
MLLGACASVPKSGDVYTGTYFYNFEFAILTPTGTHDRWCVDGDLSSAQLPGGWGTADVVVQGTVGPPGHYGNLGSCQRVIRVTKILEVTNKRDNMSR